MLSIAASAFDIQAFVLANAQLLSSDLDSNTNELLLLRLIRVLRLVKLLRLLRGSRVLKRWQTRISLSSSMQALLRLLFVLLVSIHWFSCILAVQTAFTTHAGREEIRRMFVDFMDTWKTIIHKDFTSTIDEKNGRITASFTAELEDHDGNWTTLHNTNFWRIRGNKFQEVYIYMSGENPLV